MEYYKTKSILHVKQFLGHKQIKNTEIYTHLINFESDEWHVATAKTLEEESKLIEAGFGGGRHWGYLVTEPGSLVIELEELLEGKALLDD